MIVTTVTVKVETDHIDDFIAATIANHESSVSEPGNLRFDVLQSREDPASFMLYEAYESEEAARAHKQTAHYLRWKETVADWMAEPRRGHLHAVIRPTDRDLW